MTTPMLHFRPVLALAVGLGGCSTGAPRPATPHAAVTTPVTNPPPAAVIAEPGTQPGLFTPPPRTKETGCPFGGRFLTQRALPAPS